MTQSIKRLFCAVKILPDDNFLESYRDLREALANERIKWVEEQNIHITLKFFGDTEVKRIPEISHVLENAGKRIPVFSFSLKGLGIFGSSYEPRVIWVGIEPYRELAEAMKVLRDELKKIGFEPDRQNLVPHLTLGRIKFLKDKLAFRKVVDDFRNISSGEIRVDSFILFESLLKREGPEYIPLKKFMLLI